MAIFDKNQPLWLLVTILVNFFLCKCQRNRPKIANICYKYSSIFQKTANVKTKNRQIGYVPRWGYNKRNPSEWFP